MDFEVRKQEGFDDTVSEQRLTGRTMQAGCRLDGLLGSNTPLCPHLSLARTALTLDTADLRVICLFNSRELHAIPFPLHLDRTHPTSMNMRPIPRSLMHAPAWVMYEMLQPGSKLHKLGNDPEAVNQREISPKNPRLHDAS